MTAADYDNLDKTELHCHVDGIVDPPLLRSLAARTGSAPLDPELLAERCPIHSFDEWMHYNELVGPLFQNQGEAALPLVVEHLLRLKAQNVIYTEIFLSSFLLQYQDMDRQAELLGSYRWAADALEDQRFQVEFVYAIGRSADLERFARSAERALECHRRGLVCGVALAGDEKAATVEQYAPWFERFHDAGMGVEIHAGEWAGADSVRDALTYGRPQRLGHGLAALAEPRLVDHLIEHNIHVEISPSSNLVLTDVGTLDRHPVRIAHERGVSFCLNSDDPGPLCVTLTDEYRAVGELLGLGPADFGRMRSNALRAAFAPLRIAV